MVSRPLPGRKHPSVPFPLRPRTPLRADDALRSDRLLPFRVGACTPPLGASRLGYPCDGSARLRIILGNGLGPLPVGFVRSCRGFLRPSITSRFILLGRLGLPFHTPAARVR